MRNRYIGNVAKNKEKKINTKNTYRIHIKKVILIQKKLS